MSRRCTRALSKLGVVGLVWLSVASLGGCVVSSPPIMRSAVAGNGTATVSWSPSTGGGPAVAGYAVTPYRGSGAVPGTTVTFGPSAVKGTITGLTNGASYVFVVQAVRAYGVRSAASEPSDPVTPSPAVAVSAGLSHTCAVLAAGGVQCWGSNTSGQLGNGTATSSSSPVAVSGITDAVAVSAGSTHSCAVLAGGGVRCWGPGQLLGRGSAPSSRTPVAVPGITDAVGVSAGEDHTCVRRSTGGVRCWGYNGNGQLGNGNTGTLFTPVNVVGISDAVSVSAGGGHSCAVLAGGGARCWGYNEYGQLGSGSTSSSVPVVVPGVPSLAEVSIDWGYSCAQATDGRMICWGAFWFSVYTATEIEGITGAMDVAAGTGQACAASASGVRCWDPGAEDLSLVTIPGLAGATDVSSGDQHACAVLPAGALRCWGGNGSGQLGNGATTTSPAPVAVVGY